MRSLNEAKSSDPSRVSLPHTQSTPPSLSSRLLLHPSLTSLLVRNPSTTLSNCHCIQCRPRPFFPFQDTTIQSTLPIIDAKGGLEVTAIGEVRYQRGYYTRTEVFPVGYTARRKHRSVYGLGFGVQGLGLRVSCRINGSPQAQVGSFSESPCPSTHSCNHS